MSMLTKLPIFLSAALLAGCASLLAPPANPGDSMATVRARMGRPTEVRTLPGGTQFEYGAGTFGQLAWLANFGQDRRLVSVEQVRTTARFGMVRPGITTRDEVLAMLGRPSEVSRVRLNNYEVWSYRYKESDVWDSMMHIHFDAAGVVRMMQNGPDPMGELPDFFGE